MKMKTCKNGHRYDASVYTECPECTAAVGRTVPADDFAWGEPGKPQKTMDMEIPASPRPEHWADAASYQAAGDISDRYGPTMPVHCEGDAIDARPVTGWLVCIDGAEKGKDYRLHAEMNYIGRSQVNDVALSEDNTVSRERHALIAYDDRDRKFYFAPANGASLVRQNGRPVLSTVDLQRGDRLEIGSGTYLFIPLCGEDFQW